MKQFKEIVLGIFVIAAVSFLIYSLYQLKGRTANKELARHIAELSPKGGPPETIEGLRQAIALYEDQIERNVREGAQTGAYWKILAVRLVDKGMYNDALKALERAIYFIPEDPVLYNLAGVSAGKVAKSIVGFSAGAEKERDHYFKLSENSYKRALELDVTYAKPMYGLSVLYVFELDRPAEAIPHLERYLSIMSSDIQAMFILARAYAVTGSYTQAVETYEKIISRSKNKDIQAEAYNNIEIVQRMMYE
ncbi:MAG: tetratricopeptide repeat protein [Treponema sp.]|jgi:tetratricopeptide (TPR) repeat protein|nr:tetratricopeptide repeat protein [Treponema sp.]